MHQPLSPKTQLHSFSKPFSWLVMLDTTIANSDVGDGSYHHRPSPQPLHMQPQPQSTCNPNLNNILTAMNAQFFLTRNCSYFQASSINIHFHFEAVDEASLPTESSLCPTHHQASTTILLKWVFKDFVY